MQSFKPGSLPAIEAPIGGSFYVGQTTFLTGWFPPLNERPFLFVVPYCQDSHLFAQTPTLSSSGVARTGHDTFLCLVNGEADYDIGREEHATGFVNAAISRREAAKNGEFRDLEARLRAGFLRHEIDVMKVCFEHGVLRRHATSVLAKLKQEKVIDISFRVPDGDRLRDPRPIRMLR